jgi:spore germination protein
MYHPNKAYRGSVIGVGIAGGLYLILIYSTLSVFGTEEMKNLMWPTLELAKTAALPAFFIERLDPIFLAVWVTAVFCAIFAAYYISIQAFGHFFRMRDHRVFSIAGLPIVYVLASLPSNVHQLYTIVKIVGLCGLPLTFGYPLILLLTHWARGGKLKADKRARKAGAA